MPDDWEEHRLFIMETLKRIESKLDRHIEQQSSRMSIIEGINNDNRKEIAVIKAQAMIFGGFAGMVVGVIFQAILYLFK
ncbi:MAG: hypothetical protein WC871_03615 [Bacteroidales bacterium]|jgi:hypothetical protein